MTIFDSDMEPFSKYSPVMLHLSPATRILNENPAFEDGLFLNKICFKILYMTNHLYLLSVGDDRNFYKKALQPVQISPISQKQSSASAAS